MKNWFQFLLSISVIVFCVSTFAVEGDQSQTYGRIVSFGDSLSDLGALTAWLPAQSVAGSLRQTQAKSGSK